MNWFRGLLRLWLIGLVIWILFIAIKLDLLRTIGELRHAPAPTSAELSEFVLILSGISLGPPVAVLALLLALAWVARGFKRA
jgi:hypothetical protein